MPKSESSHSLNVLASIYLDTSPYLAFFLAVLVGGVCLALQTLGVHSDITVPEYDSISFELT